MEQLLDQILDLLDMKQLNVVGVNQLLKECFTMIDTTDQENINALVKKRNIIENRMRMIDETLQRGQLALIGFERIKPYVDKFYTHH